VYLARKVVQLGLQLGAFDRAVRWRQAFGRDLIGYVSNNHGPFGQQVSVVLRSLILTAVNAMVSLHRDRLETTRSWTSY
jgi:hypothetical protein